MMIPDILTLRDGSTAFLRDPEVKDAPALLDFLKHIDSESPYMMRETGEADDISLSREKNLIRMALGADDLRWLIVVRNGEVAGSAGWSLVGRRSKYRHRAEVGVAVIESCWGLGIGKALMKALEQTAAESGVEQLELTVGKTNTDAYVMYRRLGYTEVGTAPHAMKFRDGTYEDEIRMVKFLR